MQINTLAELIETTLDENKASDIKVLDVSPLTTLTDRLVIATGRSERHNRSLANKIIDAVKAHDIKPLGIEGDDAGQGEWVLLDLADAIVHIMTQEKRDFYNLEGLWSVPQKKTAHSEQSS
ncbi:MAG: ribosome silencing factor [Gammaproteobacteria bacterium]|nr:ribosome silencing factor [Gammaproteobacteria bacterium]